MLSDMGFQERIRGSHHIFVKAGVVPQINLQRKGSQAQVYQVRQVRKIILEYHLDEQEQ
jgi:hypothetical protein